MAAGRVQRTELRYTRPLEAQMWSLHKVTLGLLLVKARHKVGSHLRSREINRTLDGAKPHYNEMFIPIRMKIVVTFTIYHTHS